MGESFALMGIVFAAAAGFGTMARLLRQPPLLGYIAAGILLSGTGLLAGFNQAEMLGQLGVTLLLFLAGLELPIADLKRIGRTALVTGLGQIIVTSVLGFGIAKVLGFANLPAIYLGIGLTFGSTILVVKLLSEKGDLQSLYGKIAMGYLLVQDFVAIGLLVVLAGVARDGDFNFGGVIILMIKGAVMVGLAMFLSGTVMNKIMGFFAKSTELLFVAATAWCLGIAAIVASPMFGFSVEIGGFLAGLALSGVAEQAQIIARVKPLRDFFLTWFFVALGAGMHFANMGNIFLPAVVLSVYVLIGNPLIVMIILGLLGYRKRTLFMASLAVAQVSEFSLIIVTRAVGTGMLNQQILTLLTCVCLITMSVSTYMIWYADKIYRKISRFLGIFESKKTKEKTWSGDKLEAHVILFGHNRIGNVIRPVLQKMGKKIVVVDFNPSVIDSLDTSGILAIYGDMGDSELYERLNLSDAEAVISTVPDINDSLHLLSEVKACGKKIVVVVTAVDEMEEKRLYAAGASFVLVPHNVGGQYLAQELERHTLGI